ncbi:MAG: FlgT C-terminal domain-containing protein [Candidatus Acidiferrales bacterium]
MRGKIVLAGLILALSGGAVSAQNRGLSTTQDDIYCSGVITNESVPNDTQLISGEESNFKLSFQEGDYVYINKGSGQGVKVGDQFSVVRAVADPTDVEWTKWQFSILKRIGTMWEDEGRLRVVVVHADTAVAQIVNSCNYMQRGDIVLPFNQRPTPPMKSEDKFDRFAPPSGKPVAMVVSGKQFAILDGTNDIIYVNLGNSQGVKVGDYFRIFRYQGTEHETAYQTKRFAFDVYGYGSSPAKYQWDNVPREVIGEGLVVRVAPNASTVLITFSLHQIYAGDYVEVE